MTDIALTMQDDLGNPRFNRGNRLVELLSHNGLLIAIMAVVLYGSLVSPVFFTAGNMVNVRWLQSYWCAGSGIAGCCGQYSFAVG